MNTPAQKVEMKLEVIVIPVADVDRAKRFYGNLGWRLDADIAKGNSFRVVQFTPPGSPASVHFGIGITSAAPGSAQMTYLIVADIEAARADLAAHGADVSEIWHRTASADHVNGVDPQRSSYASFCTFKDPDGNSWLLQEIRQRFPGRVDGPDTTYHSPTDLATALRRASIAHGEHETRTGGGRDENWPEWYAQYMINEQSGKPLPT